MTDPSPRLTMLIGSPRSGTTWLQSMLGAHPAIATPQETDIFTVYVKPQLRAWDVQMGWQRQADDRARRAKGLPLLLTEEQFIGRVRGLIDEMTHAAIALKPTASTVLEKSPSHSGCVEEIVRVAPDTSFIHIIRDGRDVAQSLMAAHADGWGRSWAPGSAAQAGRLWQRELRAARRAASAPGGYCEVRYEDLRGPSGPTELARVFAACGIDVSADGARDLLAAHDLEGMRARGEVSTSILTGGELGGDARSRQEPAGFFRSGGATWRDAWSLGDRRAFHAVAGDLLTELGYEQDPSWVGGRLGFPLWQRLVHRGAGGTARILRRAAESAERVPGRIG